MLKNYIKNEIVKTLSETPYYMVLKSKKCEKDIT
jgi:hypothetical protein